MPQLSVTDTVPECVLLDHVFDSVLPIVPVPDSSETAIAKANSDHGSRSFGLDA